MMHDSTKAGSNEGFAGGAESDDDPWTGGWDDGHEEVETEPPGDTEKRHPGIPDPEDLPPTTDPTDADWWKVLTAGTVLSVVGFVLIWPLLELGLPAEGDPPSAVLSDPTAVGALGVVAVLLAIRLLVLPVALWKDATRLQDADVDWTPSRPFYMAVGALWASFGCAYYLYKRARYTGRPRIPISDERLYFIGQPVPSNWQFIVVFGLATELFVLIPEAILQFASSPVVQAFAIAPVLALLAGRFVFLPIAFYKDSKRVNETDADWRPRTWFYVTFGYVFAFFVGIYYVAKRSGVDVD